MNTSRYVGESLGDSMVMNGSVQGVQGPMRRNTNSEHPRAELDKYPGTLSYETPPNPGAILDDDSQHPNTNSPQTYDYPYPPAEDDDQDEDVSNVLDTSITNFVDRNALAKQKRFVQGSFSSTSPGAQGGAGTFGKFRVNGNVRHSDTGSPVFNSNGKRPAEMSYGSGGVSKGQRT
jgi:hypothetical protein